MAKNREEDLRVKLPAMIHLTRMGYQYFSPKAISREPDTNICPATLRRAMESLRGEAMAEEAFDRLRSDLREMLNRPDQGKAFHQTLRDGWNGLPLIDYAHPERNAFFVIPELPCRAGKKSFRPDLTLMVNGLPLAMIEVKTEKQGNGIRAEYDRMQERYRNPEFRGFLQAAQIWAFSDSQESDPDRFLPTEGICFAAAAEGDFPLRVFSDPGGRGRRLPPADAETVKRIYEDLGAERSPEGGASRGSLSPNTATHRMLSALFSPERFLFLLRYGIRYGTELDENENQIPRKNLLTSEQLSLLWEARRKLERGYRNWQLASPGNAGESALIAALMDLLRENIPDGRVYWVAANRTELLRMDRELRGWGIRAGRRTRMEPGMPVLMEPGESPKAWLREPEERNFAGRRIFLLPSPFPGTERMNNFRRQLRGADPDAIQIRFTRSAEPERGGNFTYLLECADGTLYCGWTNDLARRVQAHNEGRGAKYTRGRGPVKLVYSEEFETREEAMSREWHLKRLPRREKERLIAGWGEADAAHDPGKN